MATTNQYTHARDGRVKEFKRELSSPVNGAVVPTDNMDELLPRLNNGASLRGLSEIRPSNEAEMRFPVVDDAVANNPESKKVDADTYRILRLDWSLYSVVT